MFIGFVTLSDTAFKLMVQTTNGSGTPVDATTHAVAYRIYAPAGGAALLTGTFVASLVDSQTGLYVTAALSITSGNGFAAGSSYRCRLAYANSGTDYVKEQVFTVV